MIGYHAPINNDVYIFLQPEEIDQLQVTPALTGRFLHHTRQILSIHNR